MFNHFAPYVYTICRRYNTNNEDAKEALQDSFLRIFKYLDRYNPEKGPLKPWIAKLCSNVCLNRLRSEKKVLPISAHEIDTDSIFTDPRIPLRSYREELLLTSIQQLSDGYRQILNLYVFEQYKHKEIASLLNISEGSSRSQLTRAKAQLKKIIEKSKITEYGT